MLYSLKNKRVKQLPRQPSVAKIMDFFLMTKFFTVPLWIESFFAGLFFEECPHANKNQQHNPAITTEPYHTNKLRFQKAFFNQPRLLLFELDNQATACFPLFYRFAFKSFNALFRIPLIKFRLRSGTVIFRQFDVFVHRNFSGYRRKYRNSVRASFHDQVVD
jgi:hypothetical protein